VLAQMDWRKNRDRPRFHTVFIAPYGF